MAKEISLQIFYYWELLLLELSFLFSKTNEKWFIPIAVFILINIKSMHCNNLGYILSQFELS